MRARRAPQIPFVEVRQLGANLTFVEGEWLPSMFRRIGYEFAASAEEIVNWCALYDFTPAIIARMGNVLPKGAEERIEKGLGFTPEQLQSTIMSELSEGFVSLTRAGNPIQSKDWSRGSGTRYCGECLREQPGVFYRHWRLWWCYICPTHHTVLKATCSACHQEVVEATLKERETRNPALCWAKLPGGDYCGHELSDTWQEPPLDPASPMLLSQMTLRKSWETSGRDRSATPPNTFRGVGIALLGAGDISRIADLARVPHSELQGLFNQNDRTGGTPPREPLAMAALMGAAYRLMTDAEADIRATIRQTMFSRPVRSNAIFEGPGSTNYLLSYWPRINDRMRGRVVRAIDADLSPNQRLVHGSAGSAEAHESADQLRRSAFDRKEINPLARDAYLHAPDAPLGHVWAEQFVPKLMWPSWAAPLGVDPRTEALALQTGLADALRVAGTGASPDAAAIAGIGRRLRGPMLGTPAQTDSILRQLCELALALRSRPGPIDYEYRLALPHGSLLTEPFWRAVSVSVGESPGSPQRHLNARRYAFLRMTAAAPKHLPGDLRFQPQGWDAARYSQFVLTMSAELKIAIDSYLDGWLWQRGQWRSVRDRRRRGA